MELLDSEGLRGNRLTFAKTFHKLTSSQGEPSSLAKQARQLAPTSQTSKAIGSDLLALLVGSTDETSNLSAILHRDGSYGHRG